MQLVAPGGDVLERVDPFILILERRRDEWVISEAEVRLK
jgi:hypothetical protein